MEEYAVVSAKTWREIDRIAAMNLNDSLRDKNIQEFNPKNGCDNNGKIKRT